MTKSIQKDVAVLLPKWEDSFKKGLLSFWILYSLTRRPMYAYEMKNEILGISQGSISVEENSIYRALKRFIETGLINSKIQASQNGPARKYFTLSPLGTELLRQFTKRNLLVFQNEIFIDASQKLINENKKEKSNDK